MAFPRALPPSIRARASLSLAGVAAGVVACLPAEVLTLRVTRPSDGLAIVRGGGGNSIVLVRGERALVWDPKLWPFGDAVAREVEASGARTTLLVNSHLHFDHGGANGLHPGATIVGSPQTIDYLRAARRDGSATPLGDSPWLPVRGETWLSLGGERVLVGRLPAGHTDSDVFLWLPERRLLATGDVYDDGFYPHVDPRHGGRMTGLLTSLERLAAFDAETVLPGHGPPATRARLVALGDFLRGLRDEVGARLSRGEPPGAVVEAMREPQGEGYAPMGALSSREQVVEAFVREFAAAR